MKLLPPIPRRAGRLLPAIAALLLAAAPSTANTAPEPRITAIDVSGNQLVISAEAPGGTTRLVLEGTDRGDLRAWRPRAIQRTPRPGLVTFTLPLDIAAKLQIEMFRVRGDTNDPLPAAFYTGKTEFAGDPSTAGNPALYRTQDGAEWLVPTATGVPPTASPDGAKTQRNVAESDIWRLHGSRLYFFNHQRGLQIVDVSKPDAPALLATHPLPASGEQMYLLGDHHVVLLARAHPCEYNWGQGSRSAIVVLDVTNDSPREVARVPLDGRIIESRMVGSALYVATDAWRPKSDAPADSGAWISGTQVTGIDLANPAQPASKTPIWIPGGGHVVTATQNHLLVGVQIYESRRWWESDLHVLDIRDPAGAVRELVSLRLDGRLQDKFKVSVDGDVLTTITAGPSGPDGSGAWRSTLTNFRLADGPDPGIKPSATRLGSVEVGHGEQLYATRFDGKRAYLVTFRQIDPLWVIDLSEPTNPRVLGELEIPGWSTYIYPMGDRLVTVGYDNTSGLRTAVQLFDVADPAKPTLLSKVPLGREWSWSEANSDEKALGVFPEAGLILVPFTSSGENQQVHGVQLVDLGRDTLAARGLVRSKDIVPRRTALSGDRVLAVSAREVAAVSIADRDRPEVRGTLELSYPVDRVVPWGPWLVEFSETHLRTRAANAPTEVRARLELDSLQVLGTSVKNGRLLVFQARPAETVWQNDRWITNSPTAVKLTLIDLAALPNLVVIGSVLQPVESWASGEHEALWPRPDVVVWSPINGYSPWGPWLMRGIETIDLVTTRSDGTLLPEIGGAGGVITFSIDAKPSSASPTDASIRFLWPGWYGASRTLFAFDISQPTRPTLASQVVMSEDSIANGRAQVADGLVYFGHDTQTSRVTGTNSYVYVAAEPVVTNRTVVVTNIVRIPYDGIVTNISQKEFSVPAWELPKPLLAVANAGALHVAGIDPSGTAFAWGDNRAGQLGLLTVVRTDQPLEIPFPGPATSIAAAKWFTVARLADGSVWMAGSPRGPDGPPIPVDGTEGALANSSRPMAGLPTEIADVSAGYHHAFARTASGKVFAWGQNERGQLGTGDDTDQANPVPVTLPAPITSAVGGGLHSLALTADGRVFAWGDNQRQQVGVGNGERVLDPLAVPSLAGVRAIAAGDFHSLALDEGNRVWSWGEAYASDSAAGAVPQPVSGLPPVRAVAAGRHHSLAVDLEGRVWSWGHHAYEPYRLQLLEPIRSVSARGSYAVANGESGRTYLWQLDDYPTPYTGIKTGLSLVSVTHTNIGPGTLYRLETNVVTKTEQITYWVERTVTNSYPVLEYFTHHHLDVVDYSVDAVRPVVRPPIPIPGAFEGISHGGALVFTVGTRLDTSDKATYRTWLEALAYDGTAAHLVRSLEVANTSKGQAALVEIDGQGNVWLTQTDNEKSHSLSVVGLDESGSFLTIAKTPLSYAAQNLGHLGATLSVSLQDGLRLFELGAAGPAISPRTQPFDLGCLIMSLDRIAWDAQTGFWAPLGDYGTSPIP